MSAKKIACCIALIAICVLISETAWCDENRIPLHKTQKQSDRTSLNSTSDSVAIKDSMGNNLMVVQKGAINPNLLTRNTSANSINTIGSPKRHESPLASQGLLSYLATSRRLQQINTGISAPGGITPTAAFDTTPERRSTS